jgi:SEC-C motif-containing protein
MTKPLCPCCSGKPLDKCCEPYLLDKKKPKTVVQLMRSRFTAYYIGGAGNYLLATWHPANRGGQSAQSLSQRTVKWQSLEIIDSSQQGDKGAVEFKATFIDAKGNEGEHHEISTFLRVRGMWYYVGDIRTLK